MLAPVPYAVIRLCWSRGWAVGAPEPFVQWLLITQPANVWMEPILAWTALTGILLTSGLLCRWGRIFPGWVPGLRGRVVLLWFPLGLSGPAAMAVWSFGRDMLLGRLGDDLPGQVSSFQAWAWRSAAGSSGRRWTRLRGLPALGDLPCRGTPRVLLPPLAPRE